MKCLKYITKPTKIQYINKRYGILRKMADDTSQCHSASKKQFSFSSLVRDFKIPTSMNGYWSRVHLLYILRLTWERKLHSRHALLCLELQKKPSQLLWKVKLLRFITIFLKLASEPAVRKKNSSVCTNRPILELLGIRLLPNCSKAPLWVRIVFFVAGLPETKRTWCT